ncbi:hypothetical protein [Candidatus Uabimicrobium amorphum]|uniref:Uncharacterized protein n=1 Tax=Uabimicrobium amorphum TaxID=2596890 RepID=A0A5S9ILD5_UABAM|nr:hypothetical protein [Candidatus Uabimicrobium amorphum]BBM83576.1 hypothetical protein UABAM_01929 [Candidatus Uabimicrobium amorphum]
MRYIIIALMMFTWVAADKVSDTEYVLHPHKPVRSLSFSIEDSLGSKANAYQIIDKRLRKEITGKTLFSVGVELNLKIKFATFETVDCDVVIQPGIGAMLIKCERLTKLRKQNFFVEKDYRVIDGARYAYEFFANGERIETHLFNKTTTKKGVDYTIAVPRFTDKIKVSCGFYFQFFPATSRKINIYRIKDVDVRAYIRHLKSLEKRGGSYIINKVARFVRSHQSYLKKSEHVEELIDYLLSFDLSARSSFQLENILRQLEDF